ncbi:prolyl oligopeptidase family serine peptidase [Verrucomicrobium sp. BvORR106]|uniref:prolyl oligopeptidase family serine peptidase n=1 Tax=Verrucomicrobium sp. BvORR106 TaxID=1403819 RepID=UPI00068CCD75|nr:prolyl oligopeptidase family serine peptidase [Verrucomicrobium sp. BvORR106]
MSLTLSFSVLPGAGADSPLTYPKTRHADVVDTYHGVKVPDPFRWLEDDNSEETKAWVKAQNEVTFGYLNQLPRRAALRERLQKLWNFERFGVPYKRGERYFFSRNSGLQNQSVLYVADSLTAEPKALLDPNTLSKDGTVSLTESEPSEDGKLLVWGTSGGGSDWQEFRIKNIDTGEDLPETLKWIKFSGASWAKDGSGFYYSRFPEPKAGAALTQANKNKTVYFHKLNTPQSEDKLVYARPDQPDWGLNAGVTDDGRYLIFHISLGTDPKSRVYYKDLQTDGPVVELLNDFDAAYGFVENIGPVFYFHTDLDAPRYRVIAIDTTKPGKTGWREVIPQTENKLESASVVGGQLICEYLQDARSMVKAYDLEGKWLRDVALPGLGSVGGFGGRKEDKETFYAYSSFTSPSTIYRYDVASGNSTPYRVPKLDFDGSPYETKQIFFTSKDGTRVPMFLVHKKGIKLDGANPTLLYGYGGFDISLSPGFSVSRAVWLEMGGVFALANLRGGGEYGSEWHDAGIKLKKQNVFDDFIGAAEWLVKEGYTRPAKLAIQGGSNGGLLVGACMAQRPDLFGAALPAVGVMDMLRFHEFTIGWAWKSDYGSSEDPAEFKALYAYSPLHSLKPGTRYPATLVTTADHDDRVVPAHSFKFAARLQECQAKDGPPVLIRIETSAGHGAGTALTKVMDETADAWAFLAKELGIQ